jgi:hypothetical protein
VEKTEGRCSMYYTLCTAEGVQCTHYRNLWLKVKNQENQKPCKELYTYLRMMGMDS